MPDAPKNVWDEINSALEKESADYSRELTAHVEDYEEETGLTGEPLEKHPVAKKS
jgi:hypothetical protein